MMNIGHENVQCYTFGKERENVTLHQLRFRGRNGDGPRVSIVHVVRWLHRLVLIETRTKWLPFCS